MNTNTHNADMPPDKSIPVKASALDDLRAFLTEKDDVETYVFAYRYLECLVRNPEESNGDLPYGFSEQPVLFLKAKMVEVFSSVFGE
jgi:hypothetical protein